MLGMGENTDEVTSVLEDLRAHGVSMLTLGQYLQPSKAHLPVQRYVEPGRSDVLADIACTSWLPALFQWPMVRSSYHAEQQAASSVRTYPQRSSLSLTTFPSPKTICRFGAHPERYCVSPSAG